MLGKRAPAHPKQQGDEDHVEGLRFSRGGFSIESEMQFLVRDHGLRLELRIGVNTGEVVACACSICITGTSRSSVR